MSKSLKKIVEESREKNLPDVDMCDRGISNMLDVPGLCKKRTQSDSWLQIVFFRKVDFP